MELSPEFQAQLQLQQQAEELASEEPLTPTGEQPEPAPQPEVSEPQVEEQTGLQPVETSPLEPQTVRLILTK